MIYLVTGGAGFIGSRLALELQRNEKNIVIVVDIFNTERVLHNGNAMYLGSLSNLRWFRGQILQLDVSTYEFKALLDEIKPDVIYHLAAISDTRATNVAEMVKNNVNPYFIVVDYLRHNKSARCIYASSASVYGNEPAPNKVGKENPDNLYASTKLAMDNFTINSVDDLNIIGLRFFNVFGLGEKSKESTSSVINQFHEQIMNGCKIKLFKGSQDIYRDFVSIDLVLEALLSANGLDGTNVLNVGSGKAHSFLELAEIVLQYNNLDTQMHIEYIDHPFSAGYQNYTEADMSNTPLIEGAKLNNTEYFKESVRKYLKELNNEI